MALEPPLESGTLKKNLKPPPQKPSKTSGPSAPPPPWPVGRSRSRSITTPSGRSGSPAKNFTMSAGEAGRARAYPPLPPNTFDHPPHWVPHRPATLCIAFEVPMCPFGLLAAFGHVWPGFRPLLALYAAFGQFVSRLAKNDGCFGSLLAASYCFRPPLPLLATLWVTFGHLNAAVGHFGPLWSL